MENVKAEMMALVAKLGPDMPIDVFTEQQRGLYVRRMKEGVTTEHLQGI